MDEKEVQDDKYQRVCFYLKDQESEEEEDVFSLDTILQYVILYSNQMELINQ